MAERFSFEATARGVRRVRFDAGADVVARGGRRHVERARRELAEYLRGERSYFSVPLDLGELPPFQATVLAQARRIRFGDVDSYAAIARRIGHPHAARAVGNALGANPAPILVPCHRVVRSDGTWGHFAFGGAMKTALLALERATPALVGSTTTRIACWRGCPHERRIRGDRRVTFRSSADARRAGYRPCRVCCPDPLSGPQQRRADDRSRT
ncbi:MAG: methylated-DNA--[protein]-cysteine S-methyltransferase [Candidatus Rokubacteria bacterium]|nr:methylated-DNA--[protein]-cysteine S-methyltransferase [Candidatus Rokubacteria bacterium]